MSSLRLEVASFPMQRVLIAAAILKNLLGARHQANPITEHVPSRILTTAAVMCVSCFHFTRENLKLPVDE